MPNEQKDPQPGQPQTRPTGFWIAIGIAIGAGIGVALDNIGMGIAIGIAMGAALGAVQAQRDKNK